MGSPPSSSANEPDEPPSPVDVPKVSEQVALEIRLLEAALGESSVDDEDTPPAALPPEPT